MINKNKEKEGRIESDAKNHSKRKGAFIAVILAALVLIGIGIGFWFINSDHEIKQQKTFIEGEWK